MFTLIITIIAIALVTVTILTTVWYGGSSFSKGRAKAEAAQALSESQQIVGAINLYNIREGTWPTNLQTLTQPAADKSIYLTSIPASALQTAEAWELKSEAGETATPDIKRNFVIKPVSNEEACIQINTTLGREAPKTIPTCDSITSGSGCCTI